MTGADSEAEGRSVDSITWTGDPVVDDVLDAIVDLVPDVRQQLAEGRSFVEGENPSGERVYAADEFADEQLEDALLAVDGVASYASEEREHVVEADAVGTPDGEADESEDDGDGSQSGTPPHSSPYHLAVDPLDGSSNLESNNPIGTIVGVYDEALPTSGRNLVAAGYVLYGPNTTLVVADGETVTEYLVTDGEGRTLDADVTLPDDPVVYGVGGRRPDWPDPVREFVEWMEDERLKLRYGGALIADLTQVITHGGLFSYPELDDRPEGKLRYHFECAPMGFLVECAGGRASDGDGSLLDREPDRLHERIPFYVGNEDLIERREGIDG